MRAPRASTRTMKPSATSRAVGERARHEARADRDPDAALRVLDHEVGRRQRDAVDLAQERARHCRRAAARRRRRASAPRSASRKLPSRRSAMPLGRSGPSAGELAAIQRLACRRGGCSATPPRQSAVNRSPCAGGEHAFGPHQAATHEAHVVQRTRPGTPGALPSGPNENAGLRPRGMRLLMHTLMCSEDSGTLAFPELRPRRIRRP